MLFIVIPNLGFEFSRSFLFVVVDFFDFMPTALPDVLSLFSHFVAFSATFWILSNFLHLVTLMLLF
jgi:hypothetical protein